MLFTASECRAILSAVRQCKPDHPLEPELKQAERQLKKARDVAHLIIEVRADLVPQTGPFWVWWKPSAKGGAVGLHMSGIAALKPASPLSSRAYWNWTTWWV